MSGSPLHARTKTRVLLVRHAVHDLVTTTLCGRSGPGLSAAGRAQAEALAEVLAEADPAAVCSSPQRRARETAEVIGLRCEVGCLEVTALDEIDFGAWTGMRFADLAGDSEWARWNEGRHQHRAPGGETMLEVQARMRDWLVQAGREQAGETVVAVSHGDVIKATLFLAMGLSLELHHRVEVDPGSVSEIVVEEWGIKVVRINQVPFDRKRQ